MKIKFLTVFCSYPKLEGNEANSAATLIEKLLKEKVAACVSRVESITSAFIWQGHLDNVNEELWIIKTTKAQFPKLCETIKKYHPYDCPEIVALPIIAGNPEYLSWLEESSEGASDEAKAMEDSKG